MTIDPIIAPLIHSPRLPAYLDELNAFYAVEKEKRQEFYEWLTDEVKAEFIEGEVVVHSPAKNQHIEACGNLYRLISLYVDVNCLGSVKMEKALVKLTRNDFEPDLCFFNKEKSDLFHKQTMFFPAPDLVVGILSDSTESRDRGIKFNDCALHSVAEYWIVDAEKEVVEQYFLEGTDYLRHVKANDGTITSRAIKNFRIPIDAIFQKEKNVAALQKLLEK